MTAPDLRGDGLYDTLAEEETLPTGYVICRGCGTVRHVEADDPCEGCLP